MSSPDPAPHAALGASAALLGVWEGSGHGDYPTIEPFDYRERVVFSHVGKPFLSYVQGTRHAVDGRGLHAEAGYLRCVGSDDVELVLAQPTGIAELHAGGWTTPSTLELTGTALARTPTAADVTAVRRTLELHGDVLRYRLELAAVGLPLQLHLEAELHRTGPAA